MSAHVRQFAGKSILLPRHEQRIFGLSDLYSSERGLPDNCTMLNDKPEQIAIWTDDGRIDSAAEVVLTLNPTGSVRIDVGSRQNAALKYVVIRWPASLPASVKILGDHWERGYGDLEWRCFAPERTLPWYALIHNCATGETAGVGVETGASTFASWRVDETGISLVLDLRCGSKGVHLGNRHLMAAVAHEQNSLQDESPFSFAERFCGALCPAPRLPTLPIYGGNDWYFRYGANSAETVRQDSSLIRELSPSAENAPTFVIDAGWSPAVCDGGPYHESSANFPSLCSSAEQMRQIGVRPGIWIRPLLTSASVPRQWRLPEEHPHTGKPGAYLDPSIPDVLAHVFADISQLTAWGYSLIKHDFTTYDITGRWGFEMGPDVTAGNWSFADNTRTTAEVTRGLYAVIREAAGDAGVIGCNTVGHLGAGLFEVQRTGDDTSGKHWERTRKMGVNSLAFRMPQHMTFFAADADCVGLTTDISWEQNRLWLDLLGRSGTPLFVSADPAAVGLEQRAALRDAFQRAAVASNRAEPLDWMKTTCPRVWRASGESLTCDWSLFPGSSFNCPA